MKILERRKKREVILWVDREDVPFIVLKAMSPSVHRSGGFHMENRIRQTVKSCIDEWDPMRLFPSAPPDEYDSEIEKICSIIYKMNLDGDKESIIKELAFNIGEICDYNRENDERLYRIVANKIIEQIKI